MNNGDDLIGREVFNKYRIIKLIGKGSSGKAYLAEDINNNRITIKAEFCSQKDKVSLLKTEEQIMEELKSEYIPKVYQYEQIILSQGVYVNMLSMDLLSLSLEKSINIAKGKFCLKSVSYIAIEMIEILSFIDKRGIIHKWKKFYCIDDMESVAYILDFL